MTIVFPIVASLVAWMLCGSAVPMALTITLFAIIALLSLMVRLPGLISGSLVFVAAAVEFWLFQTNQALAINADLSPVFHLAIGLLWWAASDSLTKQHSIPGPWIALTGSTLLVGATAATGVYQDKPWLIFFIAALPLSAVLVSLPNPQRKRYLPIVAALIALLAVGVGSSTDRLTTWVETRGAATTEEQLEASAPARSVAESPDGTSRRLPRDADVSFNQRIELYLRTSSAGLFRRWLSDPLYVRVSTVSLFENDEVISPARSGRWLYDIEDGQEDNSIPLTKTQPSSVEDYTLLIDREATDALPLIPGTTNIATDLLFEYADGWYQLSPPKGMDRIQYTVSMPATKSAMSGGSDVFSFGAAEAGGVYLNLPTSPLADRVRTLCNGFDDNRILEEIRDHLYLTTDYSLKFSTPDGMSPVENFLFGDGQGHCELYAAAAVMMLRSVGIPSRLAYGYAGGAADRKKGIVVFRDSDFHAWAEILRPGDRWEIFDVTPMTELAANRLPESETIATLDPGAYYDFSNTTVADTGMSYWISDAVDFLTVNFIWIAGAGLVLTGVLWWKLSRQKTTLPGGIIDTPDSEPPFSPEFLRELELCGDRKPPGTTWREYVSQFGREASTHNPIQKAVDYYYAVRYAGADRDRERETAFADEIREWRSA